MAEFGDLDEQQADEYIPKLSGMGMEKTVTVYNPLPVDFRAKYTRSVAGAPQMNPNLQHVKDRTGLDLSRRGSTLVHTTHTVVLKSKSLMNLPGDIAQIAVQKLISAIIQTRNDDGTFDLEGRGGKKGMVPDPHMRQEVETEIVKDIKDTSALINRETPTEFTERQLNEMNEEPDDPAPGTGASYTPKEPVPASTGQSDTAQPAALKEAKSPAKSN